MVNAPEVKHFTAIFAGGGTGGHLMPGLSVAEELRREYPETCRLYFVGTSNALERRLVESRGFEFLPLPSLKLTASPAALPTGSCGWPAGWLRPRG